MSGPEPATAAPPEIVAAMGAAPTDEQWRAISMPLEPFVVVAGAGSGKTSVMAARIAYLALAATGRIPGVAGVLPGSVLCLTFTNKATEHLTGRVRRALGPLSLPEGEEPTVLNYHGFAQQVLDRHGLLVGVEPGTRLLSPAHRTELAVRVLDEVTFRHNDSTWQPTLVGNILSLADQAANHRVPPERVRAFAEERLERLREHRSDRPYAAALERIELAAAVERFQDLKRELRVIDFGDQITLALRAAEEFPDVVAGDYRGRFGAVVLDEYQDTNVAQADLIAAIFGDGFPVTAVGDPDQNIYGWRGASLFNLLQFTERFRRADGRPSTRVPLYTNFRSGARILEAADRVIAPLPASQRPDPDKRLAPHPPLGDGEATLLRFLDEWAEASWIAGTVRSLHDADPAGCPWGSFAVLSRKSRLFVPLQDAFRERGAPAEVVGLAGLLRTPEVVEVLAYARAVADPSASVATARLLLGPRYRVGPGDLARLAAWAGGRNRQLRGRRGDDDERTSYLLSEALAHLDEVTDLTDQGRARLGEFSDELAALREEARRPLGDFLAEVIRRTGIAAEAAADPDRRLGEGIARNLSAFLDQVHAFAPLEGELTLRAFLDHVDTVEDGWEEWSPVGPGSDDSVKVMTVHQAKGLEFDTVFVPGLARGLLPDVTLQQNPAEKGRSMDFELRGDAAILPAFGPGVTLTAFRDALRDQELFEERRTCYVALTRARRRLFATGAWWYGEGGEAKGPSAFFDELAAWARETGHARVDEGPAQPEKGDANPLVGYRSRFIREWPGPAARPGEADGLFPSGWRRAALAAARDPEARAQAAARLGGSERVAFDRQARERRVVAENLVRRAAAPETGPPGVRRQVSVGALIEYARCPKRFYWSYVRPLPRFSGPAARIGTRVHAWIESRASGQATLFEPDERPDLALEEISGEPGRLEQLQRAFLDSRFGARTPLFAERPFLLAVGGFTVAGRIDAVYGTPEGAWEVVDYKTGRPPGPEDALAGLQLDLYALACVDVWGKRPEDLMLTYLYLAAAREVTRPAGDPEATRARAEAALRGVEEASFEAAPGGHCRWCDFLPFCDPGRAWVSGSGGDHA